MIQGESILVEPGAEETTVIITTDFGLKIRYEIDMGFFFLACTRCGSRLSSLIGHEHPLCDKCKLPHPEFSDMVLIHMRGTKFQNTLTAWASELLDPFELPLAVNTLTVAMKDVANAFRRDENPDDSAPYMATFTAQEVQERCRALSGPLQF